MDPVTIASAIDELGTVIVTPAGHSMEPMLRDRRDTAVISRPKGPVRRGDVILFTAPNGGCVLHRVIRKKPGGFLTRGDNCLRSDGVIPPEKVIGKLDGYYKGEKYTDCAKSGRYKLYVFYIRASYLPRMAVKGARSLLSRLTGKR